MWPSPLGCMAATTTGWQSTLHPLCPYSPLSLPWLVCHTPNHVHLLKALLGSAASLFLLLWFDECHLSFCHEREALAWPRHVDNRKVGCDTETEPSFLVEHISVSNSETFKSLMAEVSPVWKLLESMHLIGTREWLRECRAHQGSGGCGMSLF